ncbi:hypothetical protein ACVWWR_007873 [Bradyrhizobium sp. LM3.2]
MSDFMCSSDVDGSGEPSRSAGIGWPITVSVL